MKQLLPSEWRVFSENAHLAVFEKTRPASMDRIDYALMIEANDEAVGYCTVREMDEDSVYWQFGGGLPNVTESSRAVEAYKALIEWTHARYQRITTLVENTNVRYLKLAMHFGFRIIGCRMFRGDVLVELLNERKA